MIRIVTNSDRENLARKSLACRHVPMVSGAMIGSTPDTVTAMSKTTEQMIAIVDPMSTGATLAFEASRFGLKVCCVWSDVCPEEV